MEHLSNWTDPLTAFAERGSNLNDSGYRYIEDSSYAVVRKMQTVFVPLIFLFGFLGNLLALGCFLSQSLRATSCCLYMAAKCSSDTAFLAALFVMWLNRVYVNAVNVQGVCQVTVYLSYVSGFTSVWLVLAITFENYIRICRPHLSKTRCTRRVALAAIASIVLFAVFFYSFALWTNTVLGDGEAEVPLCMAMSKFKDVLMVMTFVDTLTTLVLPTLIIVPLVLATLVAIAQSFDRKSRLQDSLINKSARSFKNSLEAMVARFLLAVSLTFVLLHTPGHLIRLKLLVDQYILHKGLSDLDNTLQRLFETLYYFNFCCSIVIFLASGANFRALFISMYCRRFIFLNSSPLPSPAQDTSVGMKMSQRGAPSLESYSTCLENSGFG